MNIPKFAIDNMIRPFRLSIEAVSRPSAKKHAGEKLAEIKKTFIKHQPPIVIGDYIGSGGFSDVFSATSDYNGVRDFAIKILRGGLMVPRRGKSFTPANEEMRIKDIKKRFTNESYVQWDLSQHLSDLVSQSVVKVYDHGEFDTRRRYRFILMERMQSTLRDFIKNKNNYLNDSHSLKHKALLMTKIADIIFNVHQEGIFHRDIKPENILVEEGTLEPKLNDFSAVRATNIHDPGSYRIVGETAGYSPTDILGPVYEDLPINPAWDIHAFARTILAILSAPPEADTGYSRIENVIWRM